jgi:hypothetical protein
MTYGRDNLYLNNALPYYKCLYLVLSHYSPAMYSDFELNLIHPLLYFLLTAV